MGPYVTPMSPQGPPRRCPMGCAAAPMHRAQDVVKRCGDGGQVPVVDRAVLDLDGELPQEIHPGELARRRLCCWRRGHDGHHSLDDLDRATSGRRGAALLPGPVPAGG